MYKDPNDRYLVLYADDDADDVDLMMEAFSKFTRMFVLTKKDGLEVLNFLDEAVKDNNLPCLVILDINMPRLDGKETLKQLRKIEAFNELPVVLFTTSSSPEDEKFAHKLNAGYLIKPMDTNQLEFIANHLIEYCSDEVKKNVLQKTDNT